MERIHPYRLVAFDLDNTILDQGKMSKSTITALKKLRKNGVITAVATGRHIRIVPGVFRKKHLADFIISANGSAIFDVGSGELSCQGCMTAADALNAVQMCKHCGGHFNLFLRDRVLTERAVNQLFDRQREKKEDGLRLFRNRIFMWSLFFHSLSNRIDDAEDYLSANTGVGVEKMDVFFEREEDACLAAEMLSADIRYAAAKSRRYVEISSKDNTKGNGLAWICQKLGIDRGETIAFGDSGNDISMADHAGLFVAMGNAEAAVKQCAGRIAPDVRHDGFAITLQEIFGL